jgi:hypothetical protein
MKIREGELICYHETYQNVYSHFKERKDMIWEESLALQRDICDANFFYTSKDTKLKNDLQTKLFRVQQLRKEIQKQYAHTFGNELDLEGLKLQYGQRQQEKK